MTNEHRCHRPTLRGWSCMHLVAAEGDPCAQHAPGRQTPLQQAEARALAAEVASRGYRERAEKAEAERDALAERAEAAEAKATRFAGLLGHQSRTLIDAITAEVLRQEADAWDEGRHAGHEEARHEHAFGHPAPAPTEPGPKGNPRLSARFVEWMMIFAADAGGVGDPAGGKHRPRRVRPGRRPHARRRHAPNRRRAHPAPPPRPPTTDATTTSCGTPSPKPPAEHPTTRKASPMPIRPAHHHRGDHP